MKFLVALLVFAAVAAVAAVDFFTSAEVRVFPLYFLPLMLAGWYLTRTATLLTALLATGVWAAMLYLGDQVYSQPWMWPVNVLAQGVVFLLVALLFTGLRESIRREREFARTDPLTHLPNSRSFYERVGSVLAVCRRNSEAATLAYIDLDNFKQVNDKLGHHKGDELLKEVANTMNDVLRNSDVVARMGGDEFIVLLAEADAAEAETALEKLRARISDSPQFIDNDVSVSIGAASYNLAPPDVTEMIRAADKIMYRVKAAGKNSVVVQDMNKPAGNANVHAIHARR